MTGLIFAVFIFLSSWVFSSRGAGAALGSAATFFFYWTAFWSAFLTAVGGFVMVLGSAVLLRLPPQVRSLLGPLALGGGLRALVSKAALSWMGSVLFFLAGARVLQAVPEGVDLLIGFWLLVFGAFLRRMAWGGLKTKAQFKVWRPGEFPGVGPMGPDAGPFEGFGGSEHDRFERAQDVRVEPVSRIEDYRKKRDDSDSE